MFNKKKLAEGSSCDIHIVYMKEQIEDLHKSLKERDAKMDVFIGGHIEKEEKRWDTFERHQTEILEKASACPETSHIKAQNSKLDKLTDNVLVLIAKVAGVETRVMVYCGIFAILIGAMVTTKLLPLILSFLK